MLTGVLQWLVVRVGTFAAPVGGGGQLGSTLGVVAIAFGVLINIYAHAVIILIATRAMAETDAGASPTAWSAFRASIRGMWPLAGALALLIVILAALSLTVVLIPVAIYVVVRGALIAPVIAVERAGAWAAVRRSFRLTRGHSWKVLSLVVAASTFALVIGPLVGVLILLVTGLSLELVNLIAALVYVVVMPLSAIVSAYIYFDLRVREHLGDAAIDRRTVLPSELPVLDDTAGIGGD